MSRVAWDDEGVPADSWLIIEKGIFKDYQTTREQVAWIQKLTGVNKSHGCSYADSWSSVQFQRMPNVSLLPGEQDHSVNDLIAATDRGILIRNIGSWSIDHQRYNFSFSGQVFYEIRGGKIAGMLTDVAYQSNTPYFWNAMDMIGGKSSYWLGGSFNDGKGEPGQIQLGEPWVSAGALQAGQRGQHGEERLMKSLFQSADAPFLTRDQAKTLTDRVLGMAKADETRVSLNTGWSGNTRFAGAEITTSGGITDTSLTVTSTIGRRRASATTNVLDDASLRRTVDLAERLARLSPEDPERMPELGPQQYVTVPDTSNATAALTPEARAEAVKRAVDAARDAGKATGDMFVAGFLEANAGATCLATSRGLFAYHPSTDVSLGVTARTPDATGSGWAQGAARNWALLDAAALGRRAAEKAVASRNPVAMEPGMHTAVLEAAGGGAARA